VEGSTIDFTIAHPEGITESGEQTIVCAKNYSIVIAITREEMERWKKGYEQDKYFRNILMKMKSDNPTKNVVKH
jgi:hypothetical protein